MDPNIEMIVLSDDEDSDIEELNNSSVLIVDEKETTDLPVANEVLDEDVTILFSKKANILPHARFDCTIPFSFSGADVSAPENNNAEYCEQCFCYICDQLASECKFWTVPSFCHCNAHKRNVYWKSLREKRIMGYLRELKFTFSTEDMDSDLQRAEAALQEFARTLALKYAAFLMMVQNPDQSGCPCPCHTPTSGAAEGKSTGCSKCRVKHQDYTPVMEHVYTFLDESLKENPKTCAVRLLGAISHFITHTVPGCRRSSALAGAVSQAVLGLFSSAISKVQALLVDVEFPAAFTKHLQDFFQTLPFPPSCKSFRISLNIFAWDNPLLSAVLRGQNTSGVKHVNGKRPEALFESPVVVRARVLKLQEQKKYRELARYLKLVKSENIPEIQIMKDWIPLYLCKVGDYLGAVNAMLAPLVCGSTCAICRLSPSQFVSYLRIFIYGRAPLSLPHPPKVEAGPRLQSVIEGHTDPLRSNQWVPIEGVTTLLKKLDVMKFALKVLKHNTEVFTNHQSWVMVLLFTNSSGHPEPHYNFLMRTRTAAIEILKELHHSLPVQISNRFGNEYPDQALLLLATQALVWRLQHSQLTSVLKVLMTFKSNPWAVRWLFEGLFPDVMYNLLCVIVEELTDKRLRKHDMLEQSFIAFLLSLFFVNRHVNLHLYSDPITKMLFNWDEFKNPWQMHLRQQLQISEDFLTPEKRHILMQMVQNQHV
ncbi:uncharacterized protein zgc:112980 isoform X2 [Trichomycterus rosablanca]|uniref:uncharacterized protein zgc:112980 isoform X2 n=1 Tax=Trichomycterus rosablanca TaxID=2290929 RepID=UPI002F357786